MDTPLSLSAGVFTAAMMFAAGAACSGEDIRRVSASRKLLARAFAANVVIVPALTAALVKVLRLKGDIATGIVLAAICPGAPFGTFFAMRSRGNVALAVILTCGLTLLALVTTPVTSRLIFGPNNMVALPRGLGLLITVLIVILPVLLGQALHRRSPSGAARLAKAANLVAFLALLGVNIAASGIRTSGVRMAGWSGSALILLLVVISMAVGWLLGTSPENRTTLATSTGLRNAGLAVLFAEYSFPGSRVELGVAAYSILMLVPNFVFAALARRRRTGNG
jgi:BASS family bile acid:Na+ symporter